MKGNEAIAEAAIRAGCRHYFGYPITPQTEIAAYMAKKMPKIGGVFLQAESEIASINMVYGAENIPQWPIWRRYANVEQYTVAASEYTVWETMLPPAAVLAYLLPGPDKVPSSVYEREPASDLRDLKGYWAKP
jgi:hypothetical protein